MSSPLSIAVVCYPSLGGSAVVAAELAAGLARRGHEVHVLASAPPSRTLPPCERLFFHQVNVPDYPLFEHPPYTLALASAIVDLANQRQLDILHVHYAVPHAASAFLARQALGSRAPRLITTLHGTDVTGIGIHPSFLPITRLTVAASDVLTVPSAFLRAEAHRVLDSDVERRIEVIPNFVDTDHFAPAAKRDRAAIDALFAPAGRASPGPTLFHVSNFRPLKRVADLMEVLARVRVHLGARLVVVGDGPDRALAELRSRELGLEECVCFLGKRPDFAAYLAQADAFLLPSASESFGVAALEALSSGVPVFGYRVGGLAEVVSGDVGCLVDPFDVDALAQAVTAVLSDSYRHGAMSRAARERAVNRFGSETAIQRYEVAYRRAIDSAPEGIPQ